jgi:hypothetical protein
MSANQVGSASTVSAGTPVVRIKWTMQLYMNVESKKSSMMAAFYQTTISTVKRYTFSRNQPTITCHGE